MLIVWEVRHGSVMALREIFTQQGASAGVFMPDLSWDGAVFVEVEDKGISNTMKRERERERLIDLNMQVSADGLQPNLRRPKFENVSSSTQWPILSLTVRLVILMSAWRLIMGGICLLGWIMAS